MANRIFMEAGRLRISKEGFDADIEEDADNLLFDSDWTDIGGVHQTGIMLTGTTMPISPALPFRPLVLCKYRRSLGPPLDYEFWTQYLGMFQYQVLSDTRTYEWLYFVMCTDGDIIDARGHDYSVFGAYQNILNQPYHYTVFRISVE